MGAHNHLCDIANREAVTETWALKLEAKNGCTCNITLSSEIENTANKIKSKKTRSRWAGKHRLYRRITGYTARNLPSPLKSSGTFTCHRGIHLKRNIQQWQAFFISLTEKHIIRFSLAYTEHFCPFRILSGFSIMNDQTCFQLSGPRRTF